MPRFAASEPDVPPVGIAPGRFPPETEMGVRPEADAHLRGLAEDGHRTTRTWTPPPVPTRSLSTNRARRGVRRQVEWTPARDRRGAAGSGLTCGMVTASLIQVDDTRGYVTLALLVALLAGLAAGVNRVSGLGHGRDDLVAALRATVQLAVVGAGHRGDGVRRLGDGGSAARPWSALGAGRDPGLRQRPPGGRDATAEWAGADDADRGGSD